MKIFKKVASRLAQAKPFPKQERGPLMSSEINPSDCSFARKLTFLRERQGWSKQQLADALGGGIQIGHIANWESDRHRPARKNLQLIAETFQVNLDDLINPGLPYWKIRQNNATTQLIYTENQLILQNALNALLDLKLSYNEYPLPQLDQQIRMLELQIQALEELLM